MKKLSLQGDDNNVRGQRLLCKQTWLLRSQVAESLDGSLDDGPHGRLSFSQLFQVLSDLSISQYHIPSGLEAHANREWHISRLALALREGSRQHFRREGSGRQTGFSGSSKECLAFFTTDLTSVFCTNCSEQQTAVIPVPRWSSNSFLSLAETNKHQPAIFQSRSQPSQVVAVSLLQPDSQLF